MRSAGLSLSQPLLLRGTGSRCAGSVVVAHGPSRSVACGIFPDQGSNPCPLHWQADSQPLRHQGSPPLFINVCVYLLVVCTHLLILFSYNLLLSLFILNVPDLVNGSPFKLLAVSFNFFLLTPVTRYSKFIF